MLPDTKAIREQSHLNLQHRLNSGGKRSTHKSCKDATDSPSFSLPPKIQQHLDRTSGLLLRRAPSRHRNLVRRAAHKKVSCPHHNTQQKLWYPTSTQAQSFSLRKSNRRLGKLKNGSCLKHSCYKESYSFTYIKTVFFCYFRRSQDLKNSH